MLDMSPLLLGAFRVRSNLGPQVFVPLRKGKIRVVLCFHRNIHIFAVHGPTSLHIGQDRWVIKRPKIGRNDKTSRTMNNEPRFMIASC